MRADGSKVYVRLLQLDDLAALYELRVRNEGFLEPWEPRHAADHSRFLQVDGPFSGPVPEDSGGPREGPGRLTLLR